MRRSPAQKAAAHGRAKITEDRARLPPRSDLHVPVTSTDLQGFILTRHWRDAPSGTEIEYWLATDAGPCKVVLTSHTSVAFVAARHRTAVQAHLAAMPDVQLRELQLQT